MLSLGQCHWILANEKQESIATIFMKKTNNHFICSSSFSFSFSQSVTLGLPSIHVNLMSRWIYILPTVVLPKSTHNHEVETMYLPWTTVLCWPIAPLRTKSWELCITWFTAKWHCVGNATERTNDMNDSSSRTEQRELNLDIEWWIHLCAPQEGDMLGSCESEESLNSTMNADATVEWMTWRLWLL